MEAFSWRFESEGAELLQDDDEKKSPSVAQNLQYLFPLRPITHAPCPLFPLIFWEKLAYLDISSEMTYLWPSSNTIIAPCLDIVVKFRYVNKN